MTLEEFNRPYTDAELRAKFENAGFDESIWNFCQDIYYNYQTYLENEFGWLRDGETIEQLIINLKEDEGWESESTREEAWRQAMSKEHIEVYLDQRAKGYGHHWSWIAALELDWNGNISWDWVLRNLKTIDETLAMKEVENFLNRLSEGNPEAYRKFITDLTSSEGYAEPLSKVDRYGDKFLNAYLAQQKKGKSECFCYKFAELTAMQGENIILNSYEAEAYCKGLDRGLSEVDASIYADSVMDGFLNKFRSVEPDEKRLHLSYLYVDFKRDGNNEEDAYILAYKEGYKAEEKEYNRLYAIFREEGMSDLQAQKEAYRCVSGDDDYFIARPSSRISAKDKFDRAMLEIMFPNEDIDDEDFNPADFLDND